MQELLDIGVEEYRVAGGGVLRFHPGDPNLFARFLRAEEELQALEKVLTEGANRFAKQQAEKMQNA